MKTTCSKVCAAIMACAGMAMFQASAEPIVLHFAPGAVTLRTFGRMSPAIHEHQYSLDVRKGQTLTFNFEGGGPLTGIVDCKGGGDGPFSGYGDTFVVPETGVCIVRILISPMAERWTGRYNLAITAK